MVRFWDASAIVPLLVAQPKTAAVTLKFEEDPALVVGWATRVECASALARLEREQSPGSRELSTAFDRLAALARSWEETQPGPRIRPLAERLLRTHLLRSADALQLAAAIVAADGDAGTLEFVTLDARLAQAAEREGFAVVEPA